MSYILDALKKSDHERKQGYVPDIQTIHPQLSEEVSPQRWPYVVIGLLVLGMVFLLGWMRPWAPTAVTIQESVGSNLSEAPPQVIVNSDLQSQSVTQGRHQQSESSQAAAEKVTPKLTASSSVITTPGDDRPQLVSVDEHSVPHLTEMPELIQQAVPDMVFAGHVYSSQPAQRSVIINGTSMTEGDHVIQALSVEKITRDGVIFNYQGQLFRVEILQDWSFD